MQNKKMMVSSTIINGHLSAIGYLHPYPDMPVTVNYKFCLPASEINPISTGRGDALFSYLVLVRAMDLYEWQTFVANGWIT